MLDEDRISRLTADFPLNSQQSSIVPKIEPSAQHENTNASLKVANFPVIVAKTVNETLPPHLTTQLDKSQESQELKKICKSEPKLTTVAHVVKSNSKQHNAVMTKIGKYAFWINVLEDSCQVVCEFKVKVMMIKNNQICLIKFFYLLFLHDYILEYHFPL